jgi:hypothetical protein
LGRGGVTETGDCGWVDEVMTPSGSWCPAPAVVGAAL